MVGWLFGWRSSSVCPDIRPPYPGSDSHVVSAVSGVYVCIIASSNTLCAAVCDGQYIHHVRSTMSTESWTRRALDVGVPGPRLKLRARLHVRADLLAGVFGVAECGGGRCHLSYVKSLLAHVQATCVSESYCMTSF